MKKYLNNKFDTSKVAIYFDELPLWSAPFGLSLLDAVKYKKNISVLDIGYGTGFPLTELAMRLGNTSRVYGLDLWKEASEVASKKRPSVEVMKKQMLDTGFIISSMNFDQFKYKFVDAEAMLNHYFIRLAFMDSWIALIPEGYINEIFDEIERKINETFKTDDSFTLTIPFLLIDATKNN